MTTLAQLSNNMNAPYTVANENFDAVAIAALFGRNYKTTGDLIWGFYGGVIEPNGVLTVIANGTIALSASATNYIEADAAGVVYKNTSGFTAGRRPLYTAVTNSTSITGYTDYRHTSQRLTGRLVKAMADANQTLSAAESRNDILEATGALTALRNLVVPLAEQQWTVFANTSGGFGIQVIGATGTGIIVADGKRAIVYSDGTNVVRVTPDT